MQSNQISLSRLYENILSTTLRLPNFQREFTYKHAEQKDLIASFFLNVPIGSLMVLKSTQVLASKGLGQKYYTFNDDLEVTDQEYSYLLDGQQRTTTLTNAFFDHHQGYGYEELNERLKRSHTQGTKAFYSELLVRWFIDLKYDSDPDNGLNLLGFKDLSFDGESFESTAAQVIGQPDCSFFFKEDLYRDDNRSQKPFNPILANGVGHQQEHPLIEYCVTNRCIPLYMISDESFMTNLLRELASQRATEMNDSDSAKVFKWTVDILRFFKDLINKELTIENVSDRNLERAFFVYEKRNTTGARLTAFQILKAKVGYAFMQRPNEFSSSDLEHLLEEKFSEYNIYESSLKITNASQTKLTTKAITYFTQAWSIYTASVANEGLHPKLAKSEGILSHDANKMADVLYDVIDGFAKTVHFIHEDLKLSDITSLPFSPAFLPLVYAFLHDPEMGTEEKDKLKKWYWLTCFSMEYAKDSSTASIYDCVDISDWLLGEYSSRFESRKNLIDSDSLMGYTNRVILNLSQDENVWDNETSKQKIISSFNAFWEAELEEPLHSLPNCSLQTDVIKKHSLYTTNKLISHSDKVLDTFDKLRDFLIESRNDLFQRVSLYLGD